MKILITGAGGFIGGHLVPRLLERNYQVVALVRSAQRMKTLPWSGAVTCVIGDLADESICKNMLEGVHSVIHLAGLAHVGADEAQHRLQNFENTQRLALAAQKAGVHQFVYISSCKARYPAHSPYARYKHASEEFLLALKGAMKVVCLRPGIVYEASTQFHSGLTGVPAEKPVNKAKGNLPSLLKLLSRPWLPVFLQSPTALSMISVEDCSRAIIAVLEQTKLAGRVWELNDGIEYRLQEMAVKIRKELKLTPPILWLPLQWMWLIFAVLGLIPSLRRRGMGLNSWRALWKEHFPADSAFAKASGLWPSVTLYQIIPSLKRNDL